MQLQLGVASNLKMKLMWYMYTYIQTYIPPRFYQVHSFEMETIGGVSILQKGP